MPTPRVGYGTRDTDGHKQDVTYTVHTDDLMKETHEVKVQLTYDEE